MPIKRWLLVHRLREDDYSSSLLTSSTTLQSFGGLFSIVAWRTKNYGTCEARRQPCRETSNPAGLEPNFPQFIRVFQALMQRLDLRTKIVTELQPATRNPHPRHIWPNRQFPRPAATRPRVVGRLEIKGLLIMNFLCSICECRLRRQSGAKMSHDASQP